MSSNTPENKAGSETNEETESEKEEQEQTETTTQCEVENTTAAAGSANKTTADGASFNPQVSDDEDEDGNLERVRGDAIGSTLYSERYVLSTLLKLTKPELGEERKIKPLAEDEEFEKELCALWDMTIEEDVVLLLLEHNVLELFAQTIDATEDKRLTEILVGTIGNMCSVQRTRETLCANAAVMATLLGLIGCSDTLTLIQLMRLLSVLLLVPAEEDMQWYHHFCNAPNLVSDLCFLLSNSVNETLLAHALEALNAILAKFALILPPPETTDNEEDDKSSKLLGFSDIFVKEALISSTTEAFQTLMQQQLQQQLAAVDDNDDNDESAAQLPTQNTRKTMQIFLNIHCILTQYDEQSRACYATHIPQVVDCLSRILEPLCEPMCLLPLSSFDQEVVENVNDIFLAFGDPFNARCIGQMITIWNHIAEEMEARVERSPGANEFDNDEPEDSDICYEDFCLTILDFITRTVRQADEGSLQQALRPHSPNTVVQLLDALSAGDSEADIKECCSKIKTAFESLNKVGEEE